MATWSISVSMGMVISGPMPAEQGDLVLADLVAERGVVDAEPLLRREAQHAELALVQVVVDLERRLAHLGERVDGREDRLNLPLGDEPVGLPRLGVVRE